MNKPEDIVANLAHMFKKLYIETDCQTKLSLSEVNDMIRFCFGFNGDVVEQGEKILELAQMTKVTEGSPK